MLSTQPTKVNKANKVFVTKNINYKFYRTQSKETAYSGGTESKR